MRQCSGLVREVFEAPYSCLMVHQLEGLLRTNGHCFGPAGVERGSASSCRRAIELPSSCRRACLDVADHGASLEA